MGGREENLCNDGSGQVHVVFRDPIVGFVPYIAELCTFTVVMIDKVIQHRTNGQCRDLKHCFDISVQTDHDIPLPEMSSMSSMRGKSFFS